eukprot:TRINITY_DN7396_c0_g1_i2.p1 TRINITY_DN7396_c0_g1~~TRINITY_DN7396_c0_g1_i2.p1  ORF type:complete len:731 (+),score=165.65 TRINITY_DN7396_c0_g1_i2:103-2193(+)
MASSSKLSPEEEAPALVAVLNDRVDRFVEQQRVLGQEKWSALVDAEDPRFLGICRTLEEIFTHGLQQTSVGVVFWGYVRHLETSLPGTKGTLDEVRKKTDAPIGRGRVFLRLACNQAALKDYFQALAWNQPLTKNFYQSTACIMTHHEEISSSLDRLNQVPINVVLYLPELDRRDYWQTKTNRIALNLSLSEELRFALLPLTEAEYRRRERVQKEADEAQAVQERQEKEEKERRRLLELEKKLIEEELQMLQEFQRKQQEEERLRHERERQEEELRIQRQKIEEEKERQRREEQQTILTEALRLEQEMAGARIRREQEKKRKEQAITERRETQSMCKEDAASKRMQYIWIELDREKKRRERIEKEDAERRQKIQEEEETRKKKWDEEEKERRLRIEQEDEERRRRWDQEEIIRLTQLSNEGDEASKLRIAETEQHMKNHAALYGHNQSPLEPSEDGLTTPSSGAPSSPSVEHMASLEQDLDDMLSLCEDHLEEIDTFVANAASPPVAPRNASRSVPTSPLRFATPPANQLVARNSASPNGINKQARDVHAIRSAYYGRLLAQPSSAPSALASAVAVGVGGMVHGSTAIPDTAHHSPPTTSKRQQHTSVPDARTFTAEVLPRSSEPVRKSSLPTTPITPTPTTPTRSTTLSASSPVPRPPRKLPLPTSRPVWAEDSTTVLCENCLASFNLTTRKVQA